jgi:hypothetical protein
MALRGAVKLSAAGWSNCSFFQKARAALQGLAVLQPEVTVRCVAAMLASRGVAATPPHACDFLTDGAFVSLRCCCGLQLACRRVIS